MNEQPERCETCATCRFWNGFNPHTDDHQFEPTADSTGDEVELIRVGECRRNPPIETKESDDCRFDGMGIWAFTRVDDWCGEWQENPPKKGEPVQIDPAIAAMRVKDLNLFTMAKNALSEGSEWDSAIETVGDLVAHSAEDLLERRNFGRLGLGRLRQELHRIGLKLKGD